MFLELKNNFLEQQPIPAWNIWVVVPSVFFFIKYSEWIKLRSRFKSLKLTTATIQDKNEALTIVSKKKFSMKQQLKDQDDICNRKVGNRPCDYY